MPDSRQQEEWGGEVRMPGWLRRLLRRPEGCGEPRRSATRVTLTAYIAVKVGYVARRAATTVPSRSAYASLFPNSCACAATSAAKRGKSAA